MKVNNTLIKLLCYSAILINITLFFIFLFTIVAVPIYWVQHGRENFLVLFTFFFSFVILYLACVMVPFTVQAIKTINEINDKLDKKAGIKWHMRL